MAFGPPKLVDKANDAFCVVAASFVTLLVVTAGAFGRAGCCRVAPDARPRSTEPVPISQCRSLVYHNVPGPVSKGRLRTALARGHPDQRHPSLTSISAP